MIQMPKHISDKTTLNKGVQMPWLGLGLWQVEDASVIKSTVATALQAGYSSFDTAAAYNNEAETGASLRAAGISRSDFFLTTKLWNGDQVKGRQAFKAALKHSLCPLKLVHLDLCLIHWPVPEQDKYVEAWQALVEMQKEGLTRSIGVSNFHIHHLARIEEATGVLPAVNQVERHPWLGQQELLAYCQKKGIQLEAYSPLMRGRFVEEQGLQELASRYQKTMAQIILRWHLQSQVVVIPKSVNPRRIRENAAVFDFTLSQEDLALIDSLNRDHRLLPDPDKMNYF